MTMKSCCQYTCSILVLVLAISIGLVLYVIEQEDKNPMGVTLLFDDDDDKHNELVIVVPTMTPEQLATYQELGMVYIPQLVSSSSSSSSTFTNDPKDDPLQRIQKATQEVLKQESPFSVFRLLAGKRHYDKVVFDLWRRSSTMSRFSMISLPPFVAPIMELQMPENTMADTSSTTTTTTTPANALKFRLLRDAYFEYDMHGQNQKGCGWHVDDEGFWPAERDTGGPTIWIALDDYSIEEGGGIAIVNKTLFETLPPHNVTLQECQQAIYKKGTCNMETLHPICQEKMDKSKMEWNMKAGDAILWDRWTFHRGVPSKKKDNNANEPPQQQEGSSTIKRRYSVRYVPSHAKAHGAIHPSVERGKTFEESSSPYYPQVWPHLIHQEVQAMKYGLDGDIKWKNVLRSLSKRVFMTKSKDQ